MMGLTRFVIRLLLVCVLLNVANAPSGHVRADEEGPLRVVITDMEGGAGTVIVTPANEVVVIDCGSYLPDARDARRIAAAVRRLGHDRIDHLIITHYHRDHWGGVSQLAELIPIERFYDHGDMEELPEDPNYPVYRERYLKVASGKRTTVRAGFIMPLKGKKTLMWCVCARKVPWGPPVKDCDRHEPYPEDPTDNARSLAFVLEFGPFRAFFGGDITRNVEHSLVCPVDRVGEVDVYQADHHGLDSSNHPVLLERLNPTVILMHNGKRKGGGPRTMEAFKSARALQAIFQLHKSLRFPDYNVPDEYIANLGENETGKPIEVTVRADARSYTVRPGLNGKVFVFETRLSKRPPEVPVPVRRAK